MENTPTRDTSYESAVKKAEDMAKKNGTSVVLVKEHHNGGYGAKFANGIYRIVQAPPIIPIPNNRKKSASRSRSKSPSASRSKSPSASRSKSPSSKDLKVITPLAAKRAFSKFYTKKSYKSEKNRRRSMVQDLCRSKTKESDITNTETYKTNPQKKDYPGLDDGSKCETAKSDIARLRNQIVRREKAKSPIASLFSKGGYQEPQQEMQQNQQLMNQNQQQMEQQSNSPQQMEQQQNGAGCDWSQKTKRCNYVPGNQLSSYCKINRKTERCSKTDRAPKVSPTRKQLENLKIGQQILKQKQKSRSRSRSRSRSQERK